MTQPAQLGILQNTKFIEPTTYERHTIRYIYIYISIHRYACFPMFGGWHIACNGGEVFIGATKKGTKPGSVVSLKRCARNTANCWLLVPDISRYCLYIHAYSIPTPELSPNDICALWEGMIEFARKCARNIGIETPKMGGCNHHDNPLSTLNKVEGRNCRKAKVKVSRESGSISFPLFATMVDATCQSSPWLVVPLWCESYELRENFNHGRLRTLLFSFRTGIAWSLFLKPQQDMDVRLGMDSFLTWISTTLANLGWGTAILYRYRWDIMSLNH